MSKSQIKRLHQQQELEKAANIEEEDEESVVAPVQRKGPANRFAFFDDEDGGSEEGNQSDDMGDAPGASSSIQNDNKKKAKKNKKKAKKTGGQGEPEETENQMLTRLAAMNLKEAKKAASEVPSLEELMKIDMKQFDMSAEIKRKLGKTFKELTAAGESNEPKWPPGKRPTGRIVKNKPTWFPDRDYGLSMVQTKVESGNTWFTLRHNNSYEQRERMYWMGEKSMNVGVVQEIFSDTPYHMNSLIMMANMNRMNEDLNTGADLIERGIWYVDQHAAATFEPFNWRHRMDYLDYENRAFYLCLHRHMLNAANKRCFETALNTAKLIFKLDPTGDPLALMSLIDTYALRAKQYTWVLHLYEAAKKFKKLHLLPNWPFSVALAKFFLARTDEEKNVAQQELCLAIRHFPSVVVALMDLLQIHPDSVVMNCKMFTSFVAESECDSLKLLIKIYTKQTEEIWKESDVLLFLEQATRKVATSNDNNDKDECAEWREKRLKMYNHRSPNVDRLAQLLEIKPPTSISDPEPPKNGRCGYPKIAADPERQFADDSFIGGFIHSLLPQFNGENSFQEQLNRYGEDFLNYLIAYFQAPGAAEGDVAAEWIAHREGLNPRNPAEVIHLEGQQPVELPNVQEPRMEDSDEGEQN